MKNTGVTGLPERPRDAIPLSPAREEVPRTSGDETLNQAENVGKDPAQIRVQRKHPPKRKAIGTEPGSEKNEDKLSERLVSAHDRRKNLGEPSGKRPTRKAPTRETPADPCAGAPSGLRNMGQKEEELNRRKPQGGKRRAHLGASGVNIRGTPPLKLRRLRNREQKKRQRGRTTTTKTPAPQARNLKRKKADGRAPFAGGRESGGALEVSYQFGAEVFQITSWSGGKKEKVARSCPDSLARQRDRNRRKTGKIHPQGGRLDSR